ncbi:MAG: 16S rRNA (cytosine(967)-C(5))-methyltransferase RsmB [Butyrivibrio sp.]|nr:16S rRNA (cytosine(967)-C(5))-methyltransferase RsmB [Acetatifactor muris]MCM1558464.1 16S rRNA (cytosine(967)-C(5))-methyltransferase RsmB [Butyrivibrio sp.]
MAEKQGKSTGRTAGKAAYGGGGENAGGLSRGIALEILLTLEREKQYSNRLIKAALDKYDYLDSRDKAFIKRLTEGTLERQQELDYYLDAFSSLPVKKMKPFIRCLLRMSVYQILYMEAVPDSAACNEACKLAAKRGFGSLRGFVNGILRNISGKKDSLPLPDESSEPVKYLSVRYSVPEWLAVFWLEEYGREITGTMLAGLQEIHPVSLRFSERLSPEEIQRLSGEITGQGAILRESPYLSRVRLLERGDNIGALPGFAEGKWTVQDVSSALAVELAGIKETDFVVDVCAAPGGKSILAAEKAARVLSRDVSEEKTALIRENIARMKAENIEVQTWDAVCFDETLAGKADVVLLDVPCSGLGVMGRKRDIGRHASREGMESLNTLQREIVRVCSRYVRPGGTLLYSTCTINPAENEEMVRFLAGMPGLEPLSLEESLPELLLRQKRETEALRDRAGKARRLTAAERRACIQLLPGYMAADGFFIAKFRRA